MKVERGRLVALYDVGELPGVRPIFDLPAWTDEQGPPAELRIFKPGINSTSKGDFLFDQQAADLVMAEYVGQGNDKFFDYDHAATIAPIGGVKAIAAAWCKLQIRDTGNGPELWATAISYTPPMLGHLANKEYRYWSPWIELDADMRIVKLRNLAFTNYPATRNMVPLVDAAAAAAAAGATTSTAALSGATPEKPMKIKCAKCSKALSVKGPGADDDGDDDAYCKACANKGLSALSAALGLGTEAASMEVILGQLQPLAQLRTEVLALAGATDPNAALGTLRQHKASHEKVVALTAELATVQKAQLSGEVEALVGKAGTDGKLPPVQKAWAVALGNRVDGDGKRTGLTELQAFLAAAPVVVSQRPAGESPGAAVTLTALEEEICKRTGTDPKLVLDQKKRAAGVTGAA